MWNRSQKKASKIRGFLNVPGNVLLSHAGFPRSTSGAVGLKCRVGDGIGWFPYAIATGKNFGNWAKFIFKSKILVKPFGELVLLG